jgi:flagellar basal body-associated protein FliL
MSENPDLTALMIAILVAIIGLIGITWQLFRRSKAAQDAVAQPQCALHSNVDSRVNIIESELRAIKIESNNTAQQLNGLSRHMTAVESKIDILVRRETWDGVDRRSNRDKKE